MQATALEAVLISDRFELPMNMRETLGVLAERYNHLFSTPPLEWTAHDLLAAGLLISVVVVVSWFLVHEIRIHWSVRKPAQKSH